MSKDNNRKQFFFTIMYLREEECCEAVLEICAPESQQVPLTKVRRE
jgi:hypothetical protein